MRDGSYVGYPFFQRRFQPLIGGEQVDPGDEVQRWRRICRLWPEAISQIKRSIDERRDSSKSAFRRIAL